MSFIQIVLFIEFPPLYEIEFRSLFISRKFVKCQKYFITLCFFKASYWRLGNRIVG